MGEALRRTVNLLSKLRSSSLFGTGRSRAAVPRPCGSKDAIGGGSGWPWAAALLSSWRMKAFAATVWLAMRMPAAPCRARIAESHSLDSMLMKCMLAPASSRFATDLAVLYGLLCSCARVPLGRCR